MHRTCVTSRHARSCLACLVVGIIQTPNRAYGGLVVENWALFVIVTDEAGQDYDVFESVESPFVTDHAAQRGLSTAYSSYEFAWSDFDGSFLIQGSHQAHDAAGGFLRSTSNGVIVFTSPQDLLITVDAEYSYQLPSSTVSAALIVEVSEVGTHEEFMAHSFLETSPGVGTFEVHDQTLLPAGREYFFQYDMKLDAFENTGVLATGDGFVQFTLTPVPEAGTLALASLGSALLLARRRRTRSS